MASRSPLHKALLENASIQEIEEILINHPEYCRKVEKQDMRFPLHIALEMKYSTSVISKIIELYPFACTRNDAFGDLPIHTAATYNADAEAIRLICNANPGCLSVHNNDCLPLHIAIQNLSPVSVIECMVSIYPEACTYKLYDCYLPIHQVISTYDSTDLIKLFIDSYPSSLLEEDGDGNTPIQIASYTKSTKIGTYQAILETCPTSCRRKNPYSGALPIHTACRRNHDPKCLTCLLNSYPESAEIPCKIDEVDKLPIQILIDNLDESQLTNTISCLIILLKAYKESALLLINDLSISHLNTCLQRYIYGYASSLQLSANQLTKYYNLNWHVRGPVLFLLKKILDIFSSRCSKISPGEYLRCMSSLKPLEYTSVIMKLCLGACGSVSSISCVLIRHIMMFI